MKRARLAALVGLAVAGAACAAAQKAGRDIHESKPIQDIDKGLEETRKDVKGRIDNVDRGGSFFDPPRRDGGRGREPDAGDGGAWGDAAFSGPEHKI